MAALRPPGRCREEAARRSEVMLDAIYALLAAAGFLALAVAVRGIERM
jgi:hypothetical protein